MKNQEDEQGRETETIGKIEKSAKEREEEERKPVTREKKRERERREKTGYKRERTI